MKENAERLFGGNIPGKRKLAKYGRIRLSALKYLGDKSVQYSIDLSDNLPR